MERIIQAFERGREAGEACPTADPTEALAIVEAGLQTYWLDGFYTGKADAEIEARRSGGG
jgi:hypothetical protein